MQHLDAAEPDGIEPEELARDAVTWTLVPDELSPTGWTTIFDDGSFCRSWSPETLPVSR